MKRNRDGAIYLDDDGMEYSFLGVLTRQLRRKCKETGQPIEVALASAPVFGGRIVEEAIAAFYAIVVDFPSSETYLASCPAVLPPTFAAIDSAGKVHGWFVFVRPVKARELAPEDYRRNARELAAHVGGTANEILWAIVPDRDDQILAGSGQRFSLSDLTFHVDYLQQFFESLASCGTLPGSTARSPERCPAQAIFSAMRSLPGLENETDPILAGHLKALGCERRSNGVQRFYKFPPLNRFRKLVQWRWSTAIEWNQSVGEWRIAPPLGEIEGNPTKSTSGSALGSA
ncbi:MAG: hypothetical protein ABSB42_07880 [Tepidisphaeraceae bacterium]